MCTYFCGILCLFSLIRNKCIRYFITVFSIIFLFVGILTLVLEGYLLSKKNEVHKNNSIEDIFYLELIRGIIFIVLIDFILFNLGNTWCVKNKCRRDSNICGCGNN